MLYFLVKTDAEGKLTIFNMTPNTYNIGLKKSGFYFYCN